MSDALNSDHDEARALHRVVRAMHDGECPKCHKVHDSSAMRTAWQSDHMGSPLVWVKGWKCPSCGFRIMQQVAEAALLQFAKFMDRNCDIFEEWQTRWLQEHYPRQSVLRFTEPVFVLRETCHGGVAGGHNRAFLRLQQLSFVRIESTKGSETCTIILTETPEGYERLCGVPCNSFVVENGSDVEEAASSLRGSSCE